jgi:hypothetical protein
LLAVAGVIVVTGVYVVSWPVSDLIARHDVGAMTGPARAAALQTARDAARGLLTFGAGLFAAGALVYKAARPRSAGRLGRLGARSSMCIRWPSRVMVWSRGRGRPGKFPPRGESFPGRGGDS